MILEKYTGCLETKSFKGDTPLRGKVRTRPSVLNLVHLNKNRTKLNSLQETSPGVELGEPKICHYSYNALEWESTFTSGLNAAKSTDYIEKCFK